MYERYMYTCTCTCNIIRFIWGYRIAGNFLEGLIFVIFVIALTVTKFTPHENLPQKIKVVW